MTDKIYIITESQREQLLASYDTSTPLTPDPLDHLTRCDVCVNMLQALEPVSPVGYLDEMESPRITNNLRHIQLVVDGGCVALYAAPKGTT